MSPGMRPVPSFPGRVLTVGTADSKSVVAVQKRLNQAGCGPVVEDGVFGAQTLEAVELFQARSVDSRGMPLTVDGRVGPMTWAALFGAETVAPIVTPSSPLMKQVIGVASAEVGVMEDPPGSNTGPRVSQYLASVGLDAKTGSFPWCAAFVFWCYREASASLNLPNPAIRTAGALDLWNQAGHRGLRRIATAEAEGRPDAVQPGMVFVISTGGGNGHVGVVERIDGVVLSTIEGNTNDGGSREGIGVFRRSGRRIAQINRGFVDFS